MTERKTVGKSIIEQLTGIFFPILSTITAMSILKSVVMLMGNAGVLPRDGTWYRLLYAVSDGFFYFLPFFLALTAARQWKTDPFIALLVPVCFLYPDFVSVLESTEGARELSLLGLSLQHATYHASVIPVLLAVGLLYFVEKPCDRFIPEAIRGFTKPIVCMLVVLSVTVLLFGPLGTWIGDLIAHAFFALYDWNPVVAGAFMGFSIQPMVVVGAHWSVVPVCINNISVHGYDVILPLLCGAVYGQAGAAFACGLKYRWNKEKRKAAFQGSFTAIIGVTEAALYGTNVPLVKPMLFGCVAGAIGGALVGTSGATCASFAFPSIVTAVAYVGRGFGMFLAVMPLCFMVAFALTMAFVHGIDERPPGADTGNTKGATPRNSV